VTAALAATGSATAATPLTGIDQVAIKGRFVALNGTWLLSFTPNGAYAIVKAPKTKTLLNGGSSSASAARVTGLG
jgi:hypothetical protein